MSSEADQLAADRAARAAARAAVEERLGQLRGALDERNVKGRLVDEAMARAQSGADEALAIASDSRWVLAATVFSLAAWFARKPLGRTVRRLAGAPRVEPSRWCPRWLGSVIRKAIP